MTRRLLATYLTITALALAVLAVPLGLTFAQRERDRLYFDIERDAIVIATLAEDPGAVVRREDLIARVWDDHWWGPTKTLDVHVASLRKRLGNPGWVATVRGVGYRLDMPT